MLPTPAMPFWSSRKDLSGTVRPAAISPSASGVKAAENGSIPSREAKCASSEASSSNSASPKRRGSVNQTWRPSSRTKRARRCRSEVDRSPSYNRIPSEGSSLSSPSTRTRLPVIRRCMTSVCPPSSPSSRYLPRRPSRSIVLPDDRASLTRPGASGRHQRGSTHLQRLDPPSFHLRLELAADGLDLRQLGHRARFYQPIRLSPHHRVVNVGCVLLSPRSPGGAPRSRPP